MDEVRIKAPYGEEDCAMLENSTNELGYKRIKMVVSVKIVAGFSFQVDLAYPSYLFPQLNAEKKKIATARAKEDNGKLLQK